MIELLLRAAREPRGTAFPELTEREREVLELIAQGHNNAGSPRNFVLSQKTVRNHVSNIFTKLQVADRAEAIVRAREAGLTAWTPEPRQHRGQSPQLAGVPVCPLFTSVPAPPSPPSGDILGSSEALIGTKPGTQVCRRTAPLHGKQ